MTNNNVTVFSNGVADFHRVFDVKAGSPTNISIPVKKSHIADILASLNISGPVKIAKPASYRPANDGKEILRIDPDNVIEGLASKLSGSQVQITQAGVANVSGTLVGLDTSTESNQTGSIETKYLVVLTDTGIQRFSLRNIITLDFLDVEVKSEVTKALKRNFESIKPDSTFVDITLSADKAAKAIIQYTIPAAAWKMSYRLRDGGAGPVEFQGNAIVDNNTDEDWNDVNIAVVTGEPITFSTDLAEVKIPRRSHVNVVKESAAGAVEVEEGLETMQFGGAGAAMMACAAPMARGLRSKSVPKDAQLYSANSIQSYGAATFDQAEVKEVGDFSIFKSASPVTIPANRSAVIPVFSNMVKDSRTVLHFKFANNASRAYRSIRFKNESDFSLTRGPCTIYEQGTFQGECIMPATKPGGETLLPHAIETGVKVTPEWKPQTTKIVKLKLAEGFYYTGTEFRDVTKYVIKNNVDREYQFVLDHTRKLNGETKAFYGSASPNSEQAPLPSHDKLSDGTRYNFTLAAKASIEVTVIETEVAEQKIDIRNDSYWHYVEQAISTNKKVIGVALARAVEIKRSIDDQQTTINQLKKEASTLTSKQVRLRDNIGQKDDAQAKEWRVQLAAAESRIQEIEEKLVPDAEKAIESIKKTLSAALQEASADWTA